jgi:glycosyltransferase involved in cell wall biosynthesis
VKKLDTALRVVHVVDAMGGHDNLWGKEKVVALLMREQRASGRIDPELVTFSPGLLGKTLDGEGFRTASLSERESHGFDRALGALRAIIATKQPDVVHSHGYRANIVARLLRVRGGLRVPLVSTCHGWVTDAPKVRFYNTIDRFSTMFSDITTVPDSRMLGRLPRFARRRYIPNAIAEHESDAGAAAFERPAAFVAGTLGRICEEKGIRELLTAADGFPDASVVFAIAGAGDLTPAVERAGENVRYVGYFSNPAKYVAALDVYVQASRKEGLSLSLLEAMRAGKPIVATDVGGTRDAVRDGESALVVPAQQPAALRAAVLRLRRDPELAARLGRNARARFESEFKIWRQHERYLDTYTEVSSR